MTINELSDFIGFNTSKIRYYERELSIPIERDTRGRRKYTENTIKLFLEIKALTLSKLKLEEIKKHVNTETLTSNSSLSNSPKIEIVKDSINNPFETEDNEKFILITKPFEMQIKQQQDRIERLLDRIEVLQDEKSKLKEEYQLEINNLKVKNQFYDLQLKECKEKLETKKWWKFWEFNFS